MVVLWSVCPPYTPIFKVRILQKSVYIFIVLKFKNKRTEADIRLPISETQIFYKMSQKLVQNEKKFPLIFARILGAVTNVGAPQQSIFSDLYQALSGFVGDVAECAKTLTGQLASLSTVKH